MLGLRDSVFQKRKIVADPHIVRVQGRGISKFFGGFIELSVLNMVPGQYAVSELIPGRGRDCGIAFRTFLSRASFRSRMRFRSGRRERLQFLEPHLSALRNSYLNFR